MFVSRRRGPSSSHLEWRIRLFGVGAIIGMAGIFADISWMVWIALGVLAIGFLLRFAGAEGAGVETDDEEDDDSHA